MRVLLLSVLLAFSACSLNLGGGVSTRSYYTLGRVDAEDVEVKRTRPLRLLVRDPLGAGFINSQKILFSSKPLERGHYQFANWVDTPPNMFAELLVRYLEKAALFESVARQSSATKADLQLNTDLLEFYHDTSTNPGIVRIEIAAELIDFKKRIIISKKLFSKQIELEKYSAEGAVMAFASGIQAILQEMTIWLDDEVAL